MTEHSVVIAGGGPTGLMLAAELALARVDVVIVERRTSQAVAGRRAGGLHARTIEVLDQRGIADRFLSAGKNMQVTGFALVRFDISDFPTRHNYGLALRQEGIERALAAWVDDLAVPIHRGLEVTGFAQDQTGVDVELSDGRLLRAKYLVGCDGGRSLIRKKAGRTGTQHRCPGRLEPGMEAGPGRPWQHRQRARSNATRPSGTRSVRACSRPPWRKRRSCAATTGRGRVALPVRLKAALGYIGEVKPDRRARQWRSCTR